MKNYSKGMLLLSAVALGLTSCSDDAPWGGADNEGGISLNFSSDARVMRQSRADDGVSPVVPDASRFEVSLAKSDDSYSKNWSTLDGFNKEKAFPIGDYTLSAFFGDVDQEGFENPCFKGSADVHVSPGVVTPVNVVATLANAMVSVRYTDEFKSNFAAYSAAVQTSGHEWVVFAQDENRPAYVSPTEEVKLRLTLTNSDNKRVEIQPASFNAVARHHYVVTIGVSGSQASGDLKLDVVFDDDVVAETVNVSLGDELFTAPAPTLTAKGFDPAVTLDTFEYAEQKTPQEFHVFAYGGLKSASLTVVSDAYTPAFGGTVELVGADDLTQKQLTDAGVDCAGFFRNVDKMGVVNISKFLENVPAGNYTISLSVVDAMTRTSEPLEFKATVKAVDMQVAAIENVGFMANEMVVQVATNCPDIKNKVKFQVPNARNQMVDAVVKSVVEAPASGNVRTRADLTYRYNYTLALEPQVRDLIDVTATVGRKTATLKVPMAAPVYTITPDAFARKVMLKVEGADADATAAIIDHIAWYNGNVEAANAISTSNISTDADGIITIIGLNPATTYTNLKAAIGSFVKNVPAFTTEAETNVPNGDFSSLTEETLIAPSTKSPGHNGTKFNGICVGGLYKAGAFDYQNYSTIGYREPIGWATLNQLTCYTGASNLNTWFIVPSTFASDDANGSVTIRSVGYSHNGKTPSKSGEFTNTKYYCENAPAEGDLQKSAGELFLGSYSFNSSANRVDGVSFTTRPSSVTFDYKYTSVNNERGECVVRVLDASGNVLAQSSTELSAVSNFTSKTVSLSGYSFGRKAAKLEVLFRSTKAGVAPKVNIPSGSALKEGGVSLNTKFVYEVAKNQYHALATGSVLTVDNVKLGYEVSGAANPSAVKHRANRK